MNKKYRVIYTLLNLLLLSLLAIAEGQLIPSSPDRKYQEYNRLPDTAGYGDNTLLTSQETGQEDPSRIGSARNKMLGFSLGVIEEYDDNIGLASEDKVSDTATIVEPSLRLSWPHKTNSLSLSYASSLLFYNKHHTANRYSHTGEATAEFRLASQTTFNLWVHDIYTLFPKDIRLTDTTRENALEGNILEVKPSLKLDHFRPVYVEAGYLYQRQDYVKQDQGIEWKANGPNFSLGREITPKWDIALLYQYLDKDYTHNPEITSNATDYHDNLAGLRLRYKPYDKLSGEVVYNRLWRDFASGENARKNLWEGIITFMLSSDVSIKADYFQSFLDDVNGDLYEHDIAEFKVEQRLGKRIVLSYGLYAYKDSYELNSRKDEALGANASTTISLLQRLNLLLQGNYEWRRFRNGEDHSDAENYYTVGAELDYVLKDRFLAFIRYLRLENIAHSDESAAGNYSSNRYAVGVRFTY